MDGTITAPDIEKLHRRLVALLLVSFGASAVAGGGGHGAGGHGAGHGAGHHSGGHGGHGGRHVAHHHAGGHFIHHHGHGFGRFGFEGWYPGLYFRGYCNRYSADFNSTLCRSYYPYYVPYASGYGAVPLGAYGVAGSAKPLDSGNDAGKLPSIAAGDPGGFSVGAVPLSASEAPESLPETGRVGDRAPAPESGL